MSADENFLARWSRRKHERRTDEKATERTAEPPRASSPARPPEPVRAAPELPPVDTLKGLASDYRDFLHPSVDESLRRSALKKLFHDPHFNVMDGLDVYIDDYSKPDPVPESMLKELLARHRSLADRAEPDTQERDEPQAPPAAAVADARAAEPPAAPLPEPSAAADEQKKSA
ncbi:MAG TPA: DUF3306 domain-containing protein [Burkholderiales bacterium]